MTSGNLSSNDYDLFVAGGGAAGFFGAITCAESHPGARIVILEKSREVLGKVRISGGGRCNVTHACFDPRELTESYPRGSRQLIGPFNRWGPADTMSWFEDRGVALKTEDDGRVFPQSDSSASIVNCLMDAAQDAGIEVRTGVALNRVEPKAEGGFELDLVGGEWLRADHVLLTLGGTRNRIGADIAGELGHRVEVAAPSLFTFKIKDPRIDDLQGLSVGEARVTIDHPELSLDSLGPVLVTHWGLSGPGILRVSSWGARDLQRLEYRFEVVVNWTGTITEEKILGRFSELRTESPRKSVINDTQFGVPARLWKRLVEAALKSEAVEMRWPHLSKDAARKLAEQLGACRFRVEGKSMNKDEFVTCGGVDLRDIQFKTMQSRATEGVYFAGEILDIDGITGGFNFQSAWTTSRIAGEAIAAAIAGA